MPKLNPRHYCDREEYEPEYTFFQCMEKGKAVFCGLGYPTMDSRSAMAVGKLLEISGGSFLRRPAVMDEAMEMIAQFMNEGLYGMQEADKQFLASVAILYLWQGMVRPCISGNARIYHYRNGQLQGELPREAEDPLFGETLRRKEHPGPAIDLTGASHQFLLIAASDQYSLDEVLTGERLAAPLAEAQGGNGGNGGNGGAGVAPEWVDGVFESFQGQPVSLAFLDLPERKKGLFGGMR